MQREAKKLLVLFQRDLREATGPIGLVMGLLVALVIALGQTPLTRDPEVAKLLSEALAVVLTTGLAFALVYRQRTDLKRERLRHLLSLPITPVQVLFSKMLACGLLSAAALLAINSLWFLGQAPEGVALGMDAVLRATLDMCVVVLLIWGLLISASILGTWRVVAVVSVALVMIRDIPESLHPLILGMPTAAAGLPLFWARVTAAALTLASLVVTERLLTLRPVD